VKETGEWRATASLIDGQTYLTDSLHRLPLKVHQMQGEEGELMVYVTASSPGIFNGDQYTISCRVSEGAHLYLSSLSATELRPSFENEKGRQQQTFHLEKNSTFEYMPEPVIPFKGSNFHGTTSVYLNEGAQAIIGEIITAGRVGMGETFQYQSLTSGFEVFWQDQLLIWDSLRFNPKSGLTGNGILEAFTHAGTLWLLSEQITTGHLHHIQETILSETKKVDCYGGASLLHKNGLVVRLLGNSAESLQQVMKACWDYFRQELIHKQPLVLPD
jgi:urease accessory protein